MLKVSRRVIEEFAVRRLGARQLPEKIPKSWGASSCCAHQWTKQMRLSLHSSVGQWVP